MEIIFLVVIVAVGLLLRRLLKETKKAGYEDGRLKLLGEIISAANDKLNIKWGSKIYQKGKNGKQYTTLNADTCKAILGYIEELQSYKNYFPDEVYSALRWHVKILGSQYIAGVNLDSVGQWIKQIYIQLENNGIKPNEVKEIQFCKHGDSRIISDNLKKKVEFECKERSKHQYSFLV